MAKALITTRFPSTAQVARKLGIAESRVERVATLMKFSPGKKDNKQTSGGRKQKSIRSLSKGGSSGKKGYPKV